MLPNNKDVQSILHQISAIIPHYCDKCGAKHNHADLEVIYNENSKVMCKLNCKSCGNSYMIQVHSQMDGAMLSAKRTPYKSEITNKEITKFSELPRIDTDEIIDVYNTLQKITSIEDFNKLF